MEYRTLGKTGLQVSEIGFGGEWLERHPEDESVQMLRYAAEKGINIVDCWMADPKSRDIIGRAMEGNRAHWIVQGHIGSTWQDGQYVRTRDMTFVRPAFEDLLRRLRTDYIDLGMIRLSSTMSAPSVTRARSATSGFPPTIRASLRWRWSPASLK